MIVQSRTKNVGQTINVIKTLIPNGRCTGGANLNRIRQRSVCNIARNRAELESSLTGEKFPIYINCEI